MNEVVELASGNPGAIACLMSLDGVDYSIIIPVIKEANIRGTEIYILWSDLSGKDNTVMRKLCENCPIDILKDASSRQDYSGVELVKPYLNN